MKKLLLSMLLMVCALGAQAQTFTFDETGWGKAVIPIQATAKQIYQYSRYFWATNTRNYAKDVLEIDDKDNNVLQIEYGRNIVETDQMGNEVMGKEYASIRIEAKEGKFRISVEQPTYDYSTTSATSLKRGDMGEQKEISYKIFSGWVNTANFTEKRQKFYDRVVRILKAYIENRIAEENF